MIDWKTQNVNIWIGYEWDKIREQLLHSVHNIDTIKEFVYCGESGKEEKFHDFTVVKVPQIWEYDTGNQNEWQNIDQKKCIQNCSGEHGSTDARASNSSHFLGSLRFVKKTIQHAKVAHTVQKKSCTIKARHRQLLTAKQMSKVMKKNELAYLAIIRPKPVQNERGVTQKVKWDQMKQMGPVRKAPPISETRKKIC